jgi:hypothetical protein
MYYSGQGSHSRNPYDSVFTRIIEGLLLLTAVSSLILAILLFVVSFL